MSAAKGTQRLILYDLEEKYESLFSNADEATHLFSASPPVKTCVGCFQCWVKTPGACVLQDRCGVIPGLLSKVQELVVISPIVYGGYSPGVKAVLDRSIGYLLPYFRIVQGEMHHQMRCRNPFRLRVLFYGSCDGEEREIAERLVRANALNLGAGSFSVRFLDAPGSIKEALL